MSRTVYLHVGIAKTGTTYLQRTLFTNRAALERHGTRYPGPGPAAHFFASLDLRGTTFQGHTYKRAEGAWARLVSQADAYTGSTMISHETLAHAKPDQIEKAVTSFRTDDVRVVVTCRDLARQIPAMWQEKVKNRSAMQYDAFLATTIADWSRADGSKKPFWNAQDVQALVERWSASVGMDKLCVVTVPPAGAAAEELWRRFAQATNLPDIAYTFPADAGNSSLGVAEAELLRRLNPLLEEHFDWPRYDDRIKKGFAVSVLGALETHGRLRLPAAWDDEVRAISSSAVSFLERSGVRVIGDPKDLEPALGGERSQQPAELTDAELLDTALRVLVTVVSDPPKAAPHRSALTSASVRFWGSVGSRLSQLPRVLRSRR